MSNNINIVNTNNWYQKMNTTGTQNVTNMVLSGTNPNMQILLMSASNDVHYLSSNYPLSKTNGFTLTFQLYITGTNLNSISAYFGVTDPSFDANGGLIGQTGAVELRIAPDTPIFQLYTNYGSNSVVATSATTVSAGAWQTVKITYTPSVTGTWVVNYNGTNIISYNDTLFTTFANNQNTICGICGHTSNTVSASIRAIDLSVKQSLPMSILKNTYSFYPEECFINKLSTHSQNNAAAAFGLRLLKADYLGPIINVRRGLDNTTLDFYADSKGNLGTTLYGTGRNLLTWLNGSIGYVTRMYDQTGNGRDVIQSVTSAQPKIGTPLLDKLSSAGKSAARGAYALYRTNSTYQGATIRLRRSADNFTSDFYSDVYGNLNNSLSADNAVNTWTNRASNLGCQGIAWSPQLNLFAATNYNGGNPTTNAIQTSPDGITWTTRTTPNIVFLAFIIWSPELLLFVATAYQWGTSGVLTSPDGINWTQRTTPNIADGISPGLQDIAWSKELSLFVCVNNRTTANTNWVITSPDAINWTQRTTPSGNNWSGVCWSPQLSLFVAVNRNTTTTSAVATSPDGITWTIRTTPSVSNMSRIRWSSELNLLVAVGTNSCITSPDGINWTSRSVPAGSWEGLVWCSELSIFAATRIELSTNCIMTSSDGINWAYRITPSTQCWDIAWSPSLSTFVAVNPLSTILITSAQGLIANSTYSSWIGSSTSYVDTWYDQSGNNFHATQSTTSFQPIYNGTLKLIDSQNSSTQFLNIPSGTVPVGTANAPYSFVFSHGSYNNANGTFIGSGIWNTSQSNVVRLFSGQPNGYSNYWYNNDLTFGTNTSVIGNTIAITYNGAMHRGYVNGTLTNTNSNHTGGTTAAAQQYLFRSPGGEYLNGQMYSVFIFGSELSDSDRFACTSNPTDLNIKYDGSQCLNGGTTNWPLTNGLKNYTYIFNGRIDGNNIHQAIIQMGPWNINNVGSAFYTINNYCGFAGFNNDAFIVPYTPFVNRKCVMMCNHNLNTGNIVINDNGTIYTGTSTSPSALNLTNAYFTIGGVIHSPTTGAAYIGNINEIIIFKNTLTAKESQNYFTPNAITRKNYRSQPCIQIKDIPKDIGGIPSGAVVALDTQMLLNMSPGGLVTSWNGFTGYNSPVLNPATFNINIIYNIPPYVSLTNNGIQSSTTNGQYLDAGSKTFNINTNGGFTAIWFGSFKGTPQNYERVLDFGNGQTNDNIIVYRSATSSILEFYFYNGSTAYGAVTASGTIVQNEWAVWTFRYKASSGLMEILKNGFQYGSNTASAAITNRTLSSTRIGRSNWTTGDNYANINTVGLYVYDNYLTDAQIASISNHLMYCTNSNLPNTLPDYNNKVVRYGNIVSQAYRAGQAMYFTGSYNTDSYLDIQDIPNWPLSFCFWFNNINSSGGGTSSPAALCSSDLTGFGIQVDIVSNGTSLAPTYSTNGSTYTAMTTSAISLSAWYHVTFIITPTSVSYYLNNTLIQTVSAVVYNTNRLVFGKSGDNVRPYNGYIQDIRVFDYALRGDEIDIIYNYNGQAGQEIINYNTPTNYLVNMSNWYAFLNTYQTGSFGISSGLSGADFYIRLTGNGVSNSSNTIFNSTRIQNYNSFVSSFLIYVETAVDHGYYFYCGATSSTTVPTGTVGTSANSSYYVYFQISGTRGIYLYNNRGEQLAYSPVSSSILAVSLYIPITIVYNRSVKNTWTVNIASNDVLTYDDPNNTSWVSNIAGDYWGIGARTTNSGMSCYIRRLELSYTPFTNSVSTNINAQNNTKFPPGAMTGHTTTFIGTSILDGNYTATASTSAGAGIDAYAAFDNNTSSFWGEPMSVYSGANGAYSGGFSTNVKNLITGTSASYTGEWLQLQVPNAVTLNSFSLMGRQDQSLFIWRTPNTFYIAGSNDGSTWQLVHSSSGAQFTSAMQHFTCNANNINKYKYFRIIVNKIGNNGTAGDPGLLNFLDIAAWNLYTQMNLVNANVITVPPYSMTANTTTFAGNSVYDGTYTLTASNNNRTAQMGDIYVISNDTYGTFENTWGAGAYYNGSTGVYVGSVSTTVSGVSQSGEWVQIEIPNPIVLYSFSLNFWWATQHYWLKSFLITGSNDGSTWTNIYDNTNASFYNGTAQTFVVTGSSVAYRYFRLIGRATSGVAGCEWWILDQWKLYTNASNFNLMKFPPAPLTADTPVTFTTVNAKNWYNVMNWGTTSWYYPVLSETDPFKQLQLTPGSSGVGTYCNISGQPILNYESFTFSFQLYCANTGNGDWIILYFGSVAFRFEIYYYNGIRMHTSSGHVASSSTVWWNSVWNDIRVVYNRGPTNTWTLLFNETQIIQYSDPNWMNASGDGWGFSTFNGAATFISYIRQLEMTINPVSIPGNSIVSGNYIASASSTYYLGGIPSYAFYDSLKNTSNISTWHSGLNYNTSNGLYNGAVSTTVSGTSYTGDWLQLQTPNALQLTSFSIYPRQDLSFFSLRSPRNFVMAGSNDNSTWYILHTATGVNDWTSSEKYFVCNSSNSTKYTYFRLVVMAIGNPGSFTSNSNCVNINNLNLFTPISLSHAITPATPKGLLDGLTWKYYDGYSGNLVSYFTTNTYINIGRFTDGTNIGTITGGQYLVNGNDYYSMEIFGYFRATVSGTYTFTLSSDDGSYLWVGSNALIGYTTGNANISKGDGVISTVTCTVTLLAGTYYPIRIHYTEVNGTNDLQFSFTPPGGIQNNNGQGFFFSGTGVDSAFPQESAKIIKDLTNTNTDGVYYILVNGISTPIHCLMNDCYDGGGWMMLMKGGDTITNTFQYDSNYWTSKNTLNAGDTTRNNADAKYNTFNYSTVKDVLCIWPSISPTSYTNPYGQNGGSIFVSDGWTWLLNNWNETTRTTPLTGFNTSRFPHQNSTSSIQTYGINNPFRYNGFSSNLWAAQSGAYVHGFNRSSGGANVNGPYVRWGFIFNNEADLASCDAYGGIGCGGTGGYPNISAGNVNGIVGFAENRRFELYGR